MIKTITPIPSVWRCPVCEQVDFHADECPEEGEAPCGPTIEKIAEELGDRMTVLNQSSKESPTFSNSSRSS